MLVKQYFGLPHAYADMSPVVVQPGYTRQYIDGNVGEQDQIADVLAGFKTVSDNTDWTIVEGTGHTGVGSIINLNNAKVASLLGADAVLVANGETTDTNTNPRFSSTFRRVD